MKRRNHLRLVKSPPRVEAEVSEDEFTRQLLTSQHGPRCAAWLARKFQDKLRRDGYFVARIEKGTEMPMWFSLAMRLFTQRASWAVREHTREGTRYFTVKWIKFGSFRKRRGALVLH